MSGATCSQTAALSAKLGLEESSKNAAGSPEKLRVFLTLLASCRFTFLFCRCPKALGETLCRPWLLKTVHGIYRALYTLATTPVALELREEMWKLLILNMNKTATS